MSEGILISLTARDELLGGAPVHVQVIDGRHRRVRAELVRVGVPHLLELRGGTYALRALLPSGDVVESGFSVPSREPNSVSIDLAPHLPHPWLEPAALLSPPVHTHYADLTGPEFSTAWIRLWACRRNTWDVVEWPHPEVLRSAQGVRFALRDLDVIPHAVQVGTGSTPWHITRLPLTTAPLVTVRPAARPLHLAVSVLSGDSDMDALLGYLTIGDTRAAELIGPSLTDDTRACHPQFRSAGLGYHLLNARSSDVSLRPELFLTAAGTADGAVLFAWSLLERMRAGVTEQSAEEVCLAFVRAASSGPPTFAQGMVRLIDGLRLAAASRTPYRDDARDLLAEYSRYLAYADMASPLLAFGGSRPDTPGQWNPGTAEIPYGAVLLTSPPPSVSSTMLQDGILPGDLVARAIGILDIGLEWAMPVKRWTEAAECVTTLQRALESSDWPVFAEATEALRSLFDGPRGAVQAVRAPDPIRTPMRDLLRRCSVMCGRSVEVLHSSPPVELAPSQRSETVQTDVRGAPANDRAVSLFATAVTTQNTSLLETCIAQFQQLLDTVHGGDVLRPAFLVNYAIALWTLNEWTDEISPQGDPIRCLAEAISLTGPGGTRFHQRVSCLHAMRTMRIEGRDSLTHDPARPGRAKLIMPTTPAEASEPLELRLQSTTAGAETAQPVKNAQASQQAPVSAQARLRRRGTQRLKTQPGYDYEHYSRLAGPLTQPPKDRPYRVRYRSLLAQEPHRLRAALLLTAAPLLSCILLVWVLQPQHWTSALRSEGWDQSLHIFMIIAIAVIEFTRLLSVLSAALSTLTARDPVPVVPETGTRVAFLTTFVPGKEPLDMVRATLEAAVRLRHRGLLHIWLLDEGDDPDVKEVCARLGVHHFSRKGIAKWNQAKGPHRAKTKHGNYNAWLEQHGDSYDYFASVDTDHIPLPNYLERMLGYFRDPDVAFVVSPQVYGNTDSWIARAAESQQFLFHALTQRAGNRYGASMLVGTNNVIRTQALKDVGGLHDSITEDVATGLDIHRSRNAATGHHWRSVYTPDVLAIGEGPNNWTDFFTQQLRWSRGTYETIIKQVPGALFSFSPGRLLHYTLTLAFYPMTALNAVLSALSCLLWVGLGIGSVDIDPVVWLMLYGNASAMQTGLYIWNRRHNVSPHEPEGSGGVVGMVMSALASPIYARALRDTLLRRRSRFVVTPKGDSASPDTLMSFRHHVPWVLLFLTITVYGLIQGQTAGLVGATWSIFGLLYAALPPTQWLIARRQAAREIKIYGAASATLTTYQDQAAETHTPQSPQSSPAGIGTDGPRHGAR